MKEYSIIQYISGVNFGNSGYLWLRFKGRKGCVMIEDLVQGGS